MGHAWAEEMLRKHIASDRLRHAYLFSGPRGVGRRTLALRFAQAINCPQSLGSGLPCGTCRVCRQIDAMQHADLNILQSTQEGNVLKVEQVRELQHMLALSPYESPYRVALLLRFEEANANAQNALLKTLEEPNPRVVILVTANDPQNLLPTISSRCEVVRLRPMPLNQLAAELQERQHLPKERADSLAHIAGGRPGYALQLASDDNLLQARIDSLQKLLELLAATRIERIQYVEAEVKHRERADAKNDLRLRLEHWLSFWRDVLLTRLASSSQLFNPDYLEQLRAISKRVTVAEVTRIVADLEHSFARIQAANLQSMLDNLLLGWPTLR